MPLEKEDCHSLFFTTLIAIGAIIDIKDNMLDVIALVFMNQFYLFVIFCMLIRDLSKLNIFNHLELIVDNILYVLAICIKSYIIIVQTDNVLEAIILILNVIELSLVYKKIINNLIRKAR